MDGQLLKVGCIRMKRFICPYLSAEVELGEERERRIQESHPDLLPEYRNLIGETLSGPDQVRRSACFSSARLFSRWFENIQGGRHLVVVVVTDAAGNRHWIIVAYFARRLAEGGVEWKKS